jgi:hypothetical protein
MNDDIPTPLTDAVRAKFPLEGSEAIELVERLERENIQLRTALADSARREQAELDCRVANQDVVRKLENQLHELSLAKSAQAILDPWVKSGAGRSDPSLGDLQTRIAAALAAKDDLILRLAVRLEDAVIENGPVIGDEQKLIAEAKAAQTVK